MDNAKCAKEIIQIIRDNEMQKKLIEATQGRDYANIGEINKIYQILDK